jgi:hypothetical protein
MGHGDDHVLLAGLMVNFMKSPLYLAKVSATQAIITCQSQEQHQGTDA